jgi:biopolymer transport protein ExbB
VQTQPKRANEEISRVAAGELQQLEGYLGLIAFVAQVAPLFGLLGTVLGMVDLFSGLEAAGQSVDASTLSAGIWKALLTTAAGLIVAIPMLGGHAWLVSQSERLRGNMKDAGVRILNETLGKDGAA